MGGGKNAETSCLDPQGPAYCGWKITKYKIIHYEETILLQLRSKNTTGGSKGVSTVNFVIFWEDSEYFANFSFSPVDTLNTDKAGEPRVTMNRPMSQLQPILDMLRNEKPAWLRAYRHPDNSAVATETQFFTSYEPVGENE